MSERFLVVVSAGLSVPSSTRLLADRLSQATTDALRADGDEVRLEVVELRELARDLTDQLLTGVPSERMEQVTASLGAADGVIAVSPIFAASYSGLFKTFVDLLDPTLLTGTPVLLGATAGSARHSLALDQALRPLFGYLRALVAPTAVMAATDDFGRDGDLSARVRRAGAELAGLVRLSDTLGPTEPTPPAPELTPFEQMLTARR